MERGRSLVNASSADNFIWRVPAMPVDWCVKDHQKRNFKQRAKIQSEIPESVAVGI